MQLGNIFDSLTDSFLYRSILFSAHSLRTVHSLSINYPLQFSALPVFSDKHHLVRADDSFGQQALPICGQSRTQSARAFWPAGERPERLWDNRLHFPRKRGFRSDYVCLSLNGSRKEKTVNSRNGGLKVFEKQKF